MSECCNDNNNNHNSCQGGCRLAVTVEDNFSCHTMPPKYFDVEIHDKSGNTVATGKVAGGASAMFHLPSDGEYAVTVTGGVFSSPHAQTRRVRCCCGSPNGVTFIFMSFEHDCTPKPPKPPCCMPVPRPPEPPCCCPPPPMPPHNYPCDGVDPHSVIQLHTDDMQ